MKRPPRRRRVVERLAAFAVAAAAAVSASGQTPPCGELSGQDVAAIRAVIEAYRAAWVAGDQGGVLATLTPDAVLLPAHGAAPIVGTAAITRYWWPAGGPPTKITKLDISVEGVDGDGRVASAHGRD